MKRFAKLQEGVATGQPNRSRECDSKDNADNMTGNNGDQAPNPDSEEKERDNALLKAGYTDPIVRQAMLREYKDFAAKNGQTVAEQRFLAWTNSNSEEVEERMKRFAKLQEVVATGQPNRPREFDFKDNMLKIEDPPEDQSMYHIRMFLPADRHDVAEDLKRDPEAFVLDSPETRRIRKEERDRIRELVRGTNGEEKKKERKEQKDQKRRTGFWRI